MFGERGPAPPGVAGAARNCWRQEELAQTRPALAEDTSADVCVVGGGLSGLTTALICAKAGLSVVLLESRAVGAGMSGRSSGAAAAWDPALLSRVEARHGAAAARAVVAARCEALRWVGGAVKEESITCDYSEVPALLMGDGADAEKELAACLSAGLPQPAAGAGAAGGALPPHGARLRPVGGAAARLDPVRYAQGLAAALERHGGRIFEGTRVKSGPFTISGKAVTLATNSTDGPSVRAARGILPPGGGGVPDALLYTPGGRHARVVPGAGGPLLLVGGGDSDHVVGQMRERYADKDPYAALEAWARTAFPAAGRAAQRWSSVSALVSCAPGHTLGLYGVNPLDVGSPKTRLITGNGGDSVVGAALGGLAVAGDILGAPLRWAPVFEPSRLRSLANLGSLSDLATEIGLNVRGYARILMPTCWRDVQGLVAPGSVERAVAPGDGQVVQEGLRKVALYRDDAGTLHRRSALCPHMHVLVQWNPLAIAATFNRLYPLRKPYRNPFFNPHRPGHGSVFDACGRCVSGPSSRDLEDLGWRRETEGRGEGGGSLVK
ncbi:MAG: hypothetical protein J3K34DRAFT_512062 [Monoraphidium minutum]|nr:MAG: hypothetical protein J3K34DRAFT_512062 [Monoraphidium minutum]